MRTSVAALLVVGLAACESAPKQDSSLGGGGRSGPSTTMSGINQGNVSSQQLSAADQQRAFTTEVGDRVFFDYDSYALQPRGQSTLDNQAAWLKRYGQWRIVVEGHADERGTREYNLALAERRATTVRSYLINQGIPADRISIVSYGKERPVALGGNDAAWAQNRRGVTVLAN